MDLETTWGNFFKAEVRTSGRKLFAQEKISIGSASDTSVQAFVRATPPFKVNLRSEGIASPGFTAACNCPSAQKGQFCKHIWGTLLGVEAKYPDFLSGKQSIDRPAPEEESEIRTDAGAPTEARTDSRSAAKAAAEQARAAYQETAKERASLYRKVQYQRLKLRAKEKKSGRNEAPSGGDAPARSHTFPASVESALSYFSDNGFPMPDGPVEDVLSEAKRKLSRVFHPDKGGSHDEIVELNRNCELLMGYLR